MDIAPLKLVSHGLYRPDDQFPREPARFVVAKDADEKELLQRVEPIRIYLRDHDMNA